jgi:hypothetical protein
MRDGKVDPVGSSVTKERGMALGLALIAIVLMGTMIVGAFFMGNQDYRAQSNAQLEEGAFAAAEFGLNRALQTWNKDTAAAMAAGAVRTRTDTVAAGVTAVTQITRYAGNLYSVVSEGRSGNGLRTNARRRIGQLLLLPALSVNVAGAVTTRQSAPNQLTLSGSATASGADSAPPGWNCPPTSTAVAGYAMPDTTQINSSSSVPPTGTPPLLQTPVAADSNTYFNLGGGLTFDSLTKLANVIYPPNSNASTIAPSTTGGVCDQTDNSNWGEPWRAPTAGRVSECENYFPIIWGQGKLQFSSGRGQGILLVSGDFIASGGTEFTGLILVRGSLTTSGGGIKAKGAVMAYNQNNSKGTMSGSTMIEYSSCALSTVMQQIAANTPPQPIKYHAWAELP